MNLICCISQIPKLFDSPNFGAAWCLVAISFVAGVVATCVACKLFCGCSKKSCRKEERRPTQQRRATAKDEPKFEKKHPAPADGSIEIYVGNLSYDLTEDQLRKEFVAYGTVNSARIITNRFNGKSKGFGFVHMPNRPEAEAAVKALNDKDILGRKLKCNEAKNLI